MDLPVQISLSQQQIRVLALEQSQTHLEEGNGASVPRINQFPANPSQERSVKPLWSQFPKVHVQDLHLRTQVRW